MDNPPLDNTAVQLCGIYCHFSKFSTYCSTAVFTTAIDLFTWYMHSLSPMSRFKHWMMLLIAVYFCKFTYVQTEFNWRLLTLSLNHNYRPSRHCYGGNRSFRHFDVLPPGRFATWTVHPCMIHHLDDSLPRPFTTWMFHPLDILPSGRFADMRWTIRPPNSSNHLKLHLQL